MLQPVLCKKLQTSSYNIIFFRPRPSVVGVWPKSRANNFKVDGCCNVRIRCCACSSRFWHGHSIGYRSSITLGRCTKRHQVDLSTNKRDRLFARVRRDPICAWTSEIDLRRFVRDSTSTRPIKYVKNFISFLTKI